MQTPEFRHTPEAPTVDISHPSQREFTSRTYREDDPPSLMRFAHENRATLKVEVRHFDENGHTTGTGCVRKYLSADDLLVLARACIDAAHDLQAHPAEALAVEVAA